MIITGIGSRDIDRIQWYEIYRIASGLARKGGFTLRSGGADGADDAWEKAFKGRCPMEIYLPWVGFNGRPENDACYMAPRYDELWDVATDIARRVHPAFEDLTSAEQKLHTRNVYQVLGNDLATPSDVVVAYAKPLGKSVSGGTATAYNLARMRGIPTYNLKLKEQQFAFFAFIKARLGIHDVAGRDTETNSQSTFLSNFFDLG